MKNDCHITVGVRFKLSFWECVKLRMAGKNAEKYCMLLFEHIAKTVPQNIAEAKPEQPTTPQGMPPSTAAPVA